MPAARHSHVNPQYHTPLSIHGSHWLAAEGHTLFKCENHSRLLHLVWGAPAQWMETSQIKACSGAQSVFNHTTKTPTPSFFPPVPSSSSLASLLLFLWHFSVDTYLIFLLPCLTFLLFLQLHWQLSTVYSYICIFYLPQPILTDFDKSAKS